MNIQIFGTKKCNETKKAQRYFKERGIKFQFIDLAQKEMSKGEFQSVKSAVGGIDEMVNLLSNDKQTVLLYQYLPKGSQEQKLLENQQLLKTPIVRNGKQAVIGYKSEVFKVWE